MDFSPAFADAISGIESGGRYGLLGPVTKSGDRAYGKYQVMGANIPSWTAQFYGHSLTPQQFLANSQAQDAVFKGQFGQYADKYGPEGAAKAWFAGPGGMNNPNAKDMLGTSVAQYGQKFMHNLVNGPTPPQYASLNAPPLISGTQAPALPPATTIGSAPIGNPFDVASLPALGAPQAPQSGGFNPFGLLASIGGGMAQSQQQAPPAPQPPQNPIAQMAMLQPPPDTRGLQQLLQNSPALRGLLV